MAATSHNLTLALTDLEDEGNYLDEVLGRDGVDLSMPTPSPGWTIAHQLGHLLWMDRVSTVACLDPVGFARQAEAFSADAHTTITNGAVTETARDGHELVEIWRKGRSDLLNALYDLPTDAKIPWFGPSMDVVGMASARIMETWAHGLDITDALDLPPLATRRLRHVAELGVRTRDFAFSIHGKRSPWSAFRIELTAPDGTAWAWGPSNATDRISGSALDFCLLVAQRRHRNDLDLMATPGPADQWLDIAQVFAGPAGAGRSPLPR